MYLRIIRAQTQPGQIDEFAKRWKEVVGTTLKSAPGFRQAYLGANRDTHRVTGVALWDTPPNRAQADQAMQQVAERARDIMAGPPEPEDYEVLAEV